MIKGGWSRWTMVHWFINTARFAQQLGSNPAQLCCSQSWAHGTNKLSRDGEETSITQVCIISSMVVMPNSVTRVLFGPATLQHFHLLLISSTATTQGAHHFEHGKTASKCIGPTDTPRNIMTPWKAYRSTCLILYACLLCQTKCQVPHHAAFQNVCPGSQHPS